VSLEPTGQIEKTSDLNLQNKRKYAQSKEFISILHPKDQLSQSKKRKKEETYQHEILHEAIFKPPLKSSKELKNTPKVTRSSQKLVGELKETTKVTRRNKKNLESKKAQILEPMPQSSRVEIWVG
jgi:hypothetical protein